MLKNCKICGREFETDKKNCCCSVECSKENYRRMHLAAVKKYNATHKEKIFRPYKRKAITTKKCAFCGKEFTTKQDRKKCCSASCRRKFARKFLEEKLK